MDSLGRCEINEILLTLEKTFTVRRKLKNVGTTDQHPENTEGFVLQEIKRLCHLMRGVRDDEKRLTDLEIMSYIERMVDLKIEIHMVAGIVQKVDWVAFDESLSVAFRNLYT